MKSLDTTIINTLEWRTGNVAAPKPSKRIHLFHQLDTLCGRTAEAFAIQEGATIDCPCCKRVLQGKPPDKGKDIIPVDFDYEEWAGKPAKKAGKKKPIKKQRMTLPKPSLTPTIVPKEELPPAVGPPDEPRLSDKPLACGYAYPQGFRHEQPGPEAMYQIYMLYKVGQTKDQLIEINLCEECYKSSVRDRNDPDLGQGGRGKIVRVFDLVTGEKLA